MERPVIASNTPQKGNPDLSKETILFLERHEDIRGLRDASGDRQKIRDVSSDLPDDFYLGSGDDKEKAFIYTQGGTFTISALANVYSEGVMAVWEAAVQEGDHQRAVEIHRELEPLRDSLYMPFDQSGLPHPVNVNYALGEIGLDYGVPRRRRSL